MAIYFELRIVVGMEVCIIFFVSPIRGGNFLGGWLLGVWRIMVRLKDSLGLGVIRLMGGDQYIQGTRYIVKRKL